MKNVKLNDKVILDSESGGLEPNIRRIVNNLLSKDDKSADKLPFEIMTDDEADEARKYFGVF